MVQARLDVYLEKLKQLIIQDGIKWNSGWVDNSVPHWIFDLRDVVLSSEGSRIVSAVLFELLQDADFDAIGGPSIVAEPIVASYLLHSQNRGKQARGFIVRKKPNTFGLRKHVEGPIKRGMKVVVVDDAMNSGGSMWRAVEALEKEGCTVVKIVTLVNFHYSGTKRFKEKNIPVESLFSLADFHLADRFLVDYSTQLDAVPVASTSKMFPEKLKSYSKSGYVCHWADEKRYVVTYKNGLVVCFLQDFHTVLWSHELGAVASHAVFDGDYVVVGVTTELGRSKAYLIETATGSLAQEKSFRGKLLLPERSSLSYFFGMGSQVVCTTKQLKTLWTRSFDHAIDSLFYFHSKLLCVLEDGSFHCFSEEGELLWEQKYGTLFAIPVVLNQQLVVATNTRFVYCLDERDGSLLWYKHLKNRCLCLCEYNEKIYAGCQNGYLAVFDEDSIQYYKLAGFDITALEIVDGKIEVVYENEERYRI